MPQLRCCPWCADQFAKAIRALQIREAGTGWKRLSSLAPIGWQGAFTGGGGRFKCLWPVTAAITWPSWNAAFRKEPFHLYLRDHAGNAGKAASAFTGEHRNRETAPG